MPVEPAALGSDLYSRLEGIAGIKSPSLPGSKNVGSNSENGAKTKGLFSTSVCRVQFGLCRVPQALGKEPESNCDGISILSNCDVMLFYSTDLSILFLTVKLYNQLI